MQHGASAAARLVEVRLKHKRRAWLRLTRNERFRGAQAASLFFSAACRKAKRAIQISLRENVIGKLPTIAGKLPALP
jgi:hypothetical protein